MSMSGIFRKSFLFGLQKGRGKTEKLCRVFFNTLLWKANPCSYLQHVYQRSCSFCYNVLNFYFYIFENLIDIIIFLDILLSLIVALFKYLFYVIKIIFFITTILPFQNAVLKILI